MIQRYLRRFGTTKVPVVNSTMVWTPNEIGTSNGLIGLVLNHPGNAWAATFIERCRVKVSGSVIWEATHAQLKALHSSAFSNALGADASSLIPLNFWHAWRNPAAADVCQAPRNALMSLELVFGAAAAANAVSLGMVYSPRQAVYQPRMRTAPNAVPASTTGGRFQMDIEGTFVNSALVLTNLDRFRTMLGGQTINDFDGRGAAGTNLLSEAYQTANENTAFVGTSFLDHPADVPLQEHGGRITWELDTAAGWLPADEFSVFSYTPA